MRNSVHCREISDIDISIGILHTSICVFADVAKVANVCGDVAIENRQKPAAVNKKERKKERKKKNEGHSNITYLKSEKANKGSRPN